MTTKQIGEGAGTEEDPILMTDKEETKILECSWPTCDLVLECTKFESEKRASCPEHKGRNPPPSLGNGSEPPEEAPEEGLPTALQVKAERDREAKAVAAATLGNVREDLEKALRALKRDSDTEVAEREIKAAMDRIRDANFEISG